MDWEGKSIRVGTVAVCCAILLRLLAGGGWQWMVDTLTSPGAVSALLFLETGRIVRTEPVTTAGTEATEALEATSPAHTELLQTVPTETTVPSDTEPPEPVQAVFYPSDASLVEVNNICGLSMDVEEGLARDLSWDLTSEGPTVLIIHSHGTEGYENTREGGYRSQDTTNNMVAVGDRLVQVLETGGVKAVHDRQLHDSPSYSDAYGNARESIAKYLKEYPTIRLVLDLHRDAVEREGGDQVAFSVDAQGSSAARIMLVVGTNASGLSHPHWLENMSLAVKLHAQLEKNTPGVCRPISFRSQRFNQDLSPGALIVEMGAAGNTRQEALLAAELLGQAVIDLAQGAVVCE